MERTVPSTDSEEVDLYVRTYYSLLRTSAEVQIRSLEEAHAGMGSLLHPAARSLMPDMSAFIYSLLRLPDKIIETRLVVLGQNPQVFEREGYGSVEDWEMVSAPARRRRYFYDGRDTLATYIVSRSDIDDIVPMLTAFQIEWNKFHSLLRRSFGPAALAELCTDGCPAERIVQQTGLPADDVERLQTVWRGQFATYMRRIAAGECRLRVRLLNSSLIQYRRSTHDWWSNIERANPAVLERPIYMISSNTHSLANILSGFALLHRQELLDYLEASGDTALQNEWRDIQERHVPSSEQNFLYYVLKKLLSIPEGAALREKHAQYEAECGITRIYGSQSFDLQAQVIELGALHPETLDPRLHTYPMVSAPMEEGRSRRIAPTGKAAMDFLRRSDALILNIDYPLGMAAYHILTQIAEQVREVLGIYILGKAATLNAVIGDVMIPNVVHDEQSKNTFLFPNCFSASDVASDLIYGTVLDSQKAVTVQGTFLQTAEYMDVFYREGYTDIEMEAGPYLSAVYEMHRPKRYPADEIVNLHGIPFDLGILHYASDKPLSKGKNLGAASLSYFGMDATYAASLAVLRRIFTLERLRLHQPD